MNSCLAVEDFGDVIDRFIQSLQFSDCFREWDPDDPISAQSSHLSPVAGANHLVSLKSEPRCQDSIECSGRAAALHITELCHTRLNTGATFDLRAENFANAA